MSSEQRSAHTPSRAVAQVSGVPREPRGFGEVQRVRELEAEEVCVEFQPFRELQDVEPEVAEPPDLERPRQEHSPHIVAFRFETHGVYLLS